jgi:hypothetical protein
VLLLLTVFTVFTIFHCYSLLFTVFHCYSLCSQLSLFSLLFTIFHCYSLFSQLSLFSLLFTIFHCFNFTLLHYCSCPKCGKINEFFLFLNTVNSIFVSTHNFVFLVCFGVNWITSQLTKQKLPGNSDVKLHCILHFNWKRFFLNGFIMQIVCSWFFRIHFCLQSVCLQKYFLKEYDFSL